MSLPFIFIGGYMHSGTTLLYNIIKSQPEFFGLDIESKFFERLDYYRKNFDLSSEDSLKKYIKTLCKRYNQEAFANEILDSCQNKHLNHSQIFRITYETFALRNNAKYCVEKSPSNVYHTRKIMQLFPDAKVILIYRDFRDVLASKKLRTLTTNASRYSKEMLQSKIYEKDWSVLLDGLSWASSIKEQEKAQALRNENLFVFSYEELVTSSQVKLNELFSFIGIDNPNLENLMLSGNTAEEGQRTKNDSTIYQSALSKWKKTLDKREIHIIHALFGQKIKSLGYHLNHSVFSQLAGFMLIPTELPSIFRRFYKRYKYYNTTDFLVFISNSFKKIFN
jgi:hypothetical protein